MNVYNVTASTKREKVATIKLIRACSGMGLKESKDAVEEQICFDQWMDNDVFIRLRLTETQLGLLAHFVANDIRASIVSAKRVDLDKVDFDFSPGGFSA